jgi:hypothetical protein
MLRTTFRVLLIVLLIVLATGGLALPGGPIPGDPQNEPRVTIVQKRDDREEKEEGERP